MCVGSGAVLQGVPSLPLVLPPARPQAPLLGCPTAPRTTLSGHVSFLIFVSRPSPHSLTNCVLCVSCVVRCRCGACAAFVPGAGDREGADCGPVLVHLRGRDAGADGPHVSKPPDGSFRVSGCPETRLSALRRPPGHCRTHMLRRRDRVYATPRRAMPHHICGGHVQVWVHAQGFYHHMY